MHRRAACLAARPTAGRAAFAAAAEQRLTGELDAPASCGPGNLHLINGLFDANRSRVPCCAIAAQIPEDEIGSEYFQETHPQNLFRECSVYCELVGEPTMPRVLEIAMRTALSRGGVGVVVIPGGCSSPTSRGAKAVRAGGDIGHPAERYSLAAAAEVLNSARRVTILAGAGCAGAHRQLIDLAGLQAPVVHAFRGKEFIEYDNRFDIGDDGADRLRARATGRWSTVTRCSCSAPTSPPARSTRAACRWSRSMCAVAQIGRRVPVDVPLVGTVKDTIDALLPLITVKTDSAHLDQDDRYLTSGPAPGWTGSLKATGADRRCTRSPSPPRSTGSLPHAEHRTARRVAGRIQDGLGESPTPARSESA